MNERTGVLRRHTVRHFLSLKDFTKRDFEYLIKQALVIKKNPKKFSNAMKQKTLLMIFEYQSLRTRLSFETGMTQMGGHAIAYSTGESTLGKKETIEDFSRTASRYADIITARIFSQEMLEKMADVSRVPVINAMTNAEHPCQILGDLMTIQEHFKKLKNLKIAYVGDGDNNTTNSLIFGCLTMGLSITIASPEEAEVQREVKHVGDMLSMRYKGHFETTWDPKEAVKDADVVYTDTWMSYRVLKEKEPERIRIFTPYQVNRELMGLAKKKAIFMHCLPAGRGHEVTNDVIDGKQSVVFDQAENRMHMQKAIILWLMKK